MNKVGKIMLSLGVVFLLFGAGIGQATFSDLRVENNENEGNNDEESTLIEDINNLLSGTSPAFLIILGVLLIIGAGLAKIIGYILIVYSIIRLIFQLL